MSFEVVVVFSLGSIAEVIASASDLGVVVVVGSVDGVVVEGV